MENRKIKMVSSTVIVEKKKRFSESMLWTVQRKYYDREGIKAWAKQVPFYITSNPYIADCYANFLICFIRDWVCNKPHAIQQPFYIIELGAGSGQFGFYVLKQISYYQEKLNLQNIDIHYVMTDFTETNIRFWQQHPALKKFIQNGLLDFSIFDIENDTSITLVNKKNSLMPSSPTNPIIVLANYLFDSVKNDIFTVKKNVLKEGLISLQTPRKNVREALQINWKKISMKHYAHRIKLPYYDDEELNSILLQYKNQLKDTHLLFPIGALCCIRNLQKLSNNQLLLISSDKGYTRIEDLDGLDVPQLNHHGSFSLMVNYHAIMQYIVTGGGESYAQIARDSLVSAVFFSGIKINELNETRLALEALISGFSPTDYFNFYEHLVDYSKQYKFSTLVSFLCLSRWDPAIFSEIIARIEDLLPDAEQEVIDFLVCNITKIADNFYYLPSDQDVFFDIGVFFQEIERYNEALQYFQKSEAIFGSGYELYFNRGLCYFYTDRYTQAFENFQLAHQFKPKSKEIREWIKKAERKNRKKIKK